MNFDRWLTETPGGRHCLTILAASECEAGPVVLELAFVAGQIDQAERDRALMQEKLSANRTDISGWRAAGSRRGRSGGRGRIGLPGSSPGPRRVPEDR